MNTTRLRALWRQVGVFVVPLAAVAGGVGGYAVAQAFWPWLLVWWPWLLAGVAGFAVYGAWWLWWGLPKHQADRMRLRDPKERADAENNFRKTVGQLLGGAAVLVGAAFAYLQFQQQQTAAHDLLISNQVAKGFELLGKKDKDEVTLRLGGIYALEGVMNASDQYHHAVLEAFCAFVRDGTKNAQGDGPPTTDIQAALTVIGRRVMRVGSDKLAEFIGASVLLRKGAQEAWPDLNNARIPKADLSEAKLFGARLTGANLDGADLSDADLRSARLTGANLTEANLSGAELEGADLMGAKLTEANLSGAELEGADLMGAKLTEANLSGANLSGARLTGANLDGADLSNADLSDAELLNAKLFRVVGLRVIRGES